MKVKLLLIAILLVASNGWAQVSDEIHQRCKDVADYVGCVQISTGSVPTKDNSSEADLKKALKLLPRRLENTSLRDFSSAIQPFTDALALAETDDSIGDSQLVRDSRKIDNALSVARDVWNTSIEVGVEWDMRFEKIPSPKAFKLKRCDFLNLEVQAFNASLHGHAMNYPCSTNKGIDETIRNEGTMISIIRQAALVIADGKTLDYPQFISVEEHYAEEISRDLERKKSVKKRKEEVKNKPRIRFSKALKKHKRIYEISINSALMKQPTYRMEVKELCAELNNSWITGWGPSPRKGEEGLYGRSNIESEQGWQIYYQCSLSLALIFLIEEDYETAQEQIEKFLLLDLNELEAVEANKDSLKRGTRYGLLGLTYTIREYQSQFEQILLEINMNNQEAIKKSIQKLYDEEGNLTWKRVFYPHYKL